MRSTSDWLLLITFAAIFYVALPALLVWGWVRWGKQSKSSSLSSILSLIGFLLATFSALLAISSGLYAHAIGGFPYYDPLLLKIYRWAALLSLGGIVFGACGAWRPNPLRWHAPVCAIGMFVFWFVMATGE
jgi:hypothetical protein